MSDLSGTVALVSGAARGIGAAIAQTMVDHGAKVVIGDVLDGEGQRWPRRSARRRRTPTSTSRAPTSGRQPSQRRSTGTASSTCS